MREIVESFGFEDRKFTPERVPKNLVSTFFFSSSFFLSTIIEQVVLGFVAWCYYYSYY